MAEKYFSKQDLTDFSIQSEDGGGLVFSKDAKYIFGAKQDNITKQLNEEGYQGNVDINPNTNSSFIAIMNENSVPVDVNIPNTNQYSIFEPQEENIVQPDPIKSDCDPEFDAVLVGGLDTGTYKPLSEQLTIFKEGYGANKKIKTFSYSTPVTTITKFLKDHPKVPVIMFSAGCQYADKIAAVPGINKNKIYIVEPYNGKNASKTPKAVQTAVASGVPSKNVYIGPDVGVGKGIITNPSLTNSTKRNIDAHWDALRIVGKVMANNIKCGDQQVSTPSTQTLPPSPTPSPSIPTSPLPLTAQEIDEGIYEANFLPSVETVGAQISDVILVTDTSVVQFFEEPKNENYYNNNQPSTLTYDASGKGKATNAKEYYGDGAPYINQKTGWACLITSLVMLEQYAGKKNITEETFLQFVSSPPVFNNNNKRKPPYVDANNNFIYSSFSKDIGNIGRVTNNIDRDIAFNNYKKELTNRKKPIIIRIAGTKNRSRGHFVLAVGISQNGNILIHNPGSSRVAFKDTELAVEGLLKKGEANSGYNYDIIYLK